MSNKKDVVIAIDVSGSIGRILRKKFFKEVHRYRDKHKENFQLIIFEDKIIHERSIWFKADIDFLEDKYKDHCGNGTMEYQTLLEWIYDKYPDDLKVIFTDGEGSCNYPDKKYIGDKNKIYWIIPGEEESKQRFHNLPGTVIMTKSPYREYEVKIKYFDCFNTETSFSDIKEDTIILSYDEDVDEWFHDILQYGYCKEKNNENMIYADILGIKWQMKIRNL